MMHANVIPAAARTPSNKWILQFWPQLQPAKLATCQMGQFHPALHMPDLCALIYVPHSKRGILSLFNNASYPTGQYLAVVKGHSTWTNRQQTYGFLLHVYRQHMLAFLRVPRQPWLKLLGCCTGPASLLWTPIYTCKNAWHRAADGLQTGVTNHRKRCSSSTNYRPCSNLCSGNIRSETERSSSPPPTMARRTACTARSIIS